MDSKELSRLLWKGHAHAVSWACRHGLPLLIASMLVAAACTADPSPEHSVPSVPGASLGQEPPPDEEDLRALAERYRLDDPPRDVEFERYTSPDEYAEVLVPCLTEQGIPAEASSDGGILFGDIAPEQALLQAEAMYRCHVRFPTHPMFSEPLEDDQLRRLYGYLVGDLQACLEAEGYEVTSPPTEEAFISSYYDPEAAPWSPWPVTDPQLQDPAEWDRLSEACPQSPPLEFLYGAAIPDSG